VTELP